MIYDSDMLHRINARGYDVLIWGDCTADIVFRKTRKRVAHLEGEWALVNWMNDNGFEDE